MEHYAPHARARFEGYYSKFTLPSGASLALIISSVPNAKIHPPHMLSVTYVPAADSPPTAKIWQRETSVKDIQRVKTGPGNDFELRIDGIGYMRTEDNGASTTRYSIDWEEFTFIATTTDTMPWGRARTPESWLVWLPLPLHWHVQSLRSRVDIVEMSMSDWGGGWQQDVAIPEEDRQGMAVVHQEKNWASSFPSAHIWIQARDGNRGFCAAGGQILGMTAYLLGYRNKTGGKDIEIDFRPPIALQVLGVSPFMAVTPDWNSRSFRMDVCGWKTRLKIECIAPHGSFFGLSAPFSDGHRPNYLGESFSAKLNVEVLERTGWWWAPKWKTIITDEFYGAALEFGGDYYPPAGSESTRN